MVLKNIWKRRREEIWLFLELVVITVVAWVVIDPAVVNLYYRSFPIGYDSDRLLYARMTALNEDPDIPNAWGATDEFMPKLLEMLKSVEGVENAYCIGGGSGSLAEYYRTSREVCYEKDTLRFDNTYFEPNCNFFETYGIRPLPGSPSAEELSRLPRNGQVVLSESAAQALFGTTEGVVGRQIKLPDWQNMDPEPTTVAGVVGDVHHLRYTSIHSGIYVPWQRHYMSTTLIIRLKKGLTPEKYLEEHGDDILRTAKTRFCRICKLIPYEEYLQQEELSHRNPQEVNMKLMLALFFLVNLSLAVIGTVWLQAKRRTEECGVRRAYGATRLRLLVSFLWEGALMATITVLIGCIIFLNYAYSGYKTYGDYEAFKMYRVYPTSQPVDFTWVDHFWPHFLVVSIFVYLIILCTVLIGTVIPAWRICRSEITASLREE